MTNQEYEEIQQKLSDLIKRTHHYYSCQGNFKYANVAKESMLKCKSLLSRYNPKEKENEEC